MKNKILQNQKIVYFCSLIKNKYMDTILVLDFGSQYTQLIARKVRELNIYCEIHPYNKIPALTSDVKGVIFQEAPIPAMRPTLRCPI